MNRAIVFFSAMGVTIAAICMVFGAYKIGDALAEWYTKREKRRK